MNSIERNNNLVEGYLRLLENLNPSIKLDLIAGLSLSLKEDIQHEKKNFYDAFGKWESTESAEQLIALIKASRNYVRNYEAVSN